eukprot:TRINITY_DN37077_c0_g1_i1.p1 TRINITY_DN37077_c0_g1~~TRINITY_DN37077_c0_g1_i1.p1  ORF type:complete len:794 (-),score=97.95 TRINITY_DN37077_c0_g1_i1:56-2437(-)
MAMAVAQPRDPDDDRPPEPPPKPRRSIEREGRGRGPAVADEGIGGIVAPVRAKAPRSSSPTPATRLPREASRQPDQAGETSSATPRRGTSQCARPLMRAPPSPQPCLPPANNAAWLGASANLAAPAAASIRQPMQAPTVPKALPLQDHSRGASSSDAAVSQDLAASLQLPGESKENTGSQDIVEVAKVAGVTGRGKDPRSPERVPESKPAADSGFHDELERREKGSEEEKRPVDVPRSFGALHRKSSDGASAAASAAGSRRCSGGSAGGNRGQTGPLSLGEKEQTLERSGSIRSQAAPQRSGQAVSDRSLRKTSSKEEGRQGPGAVTGTNRSGPAVLGPGKSRPSFATKAASSRQRSKRGGPRLPVGDDPLPPPPAMRLREDGQDVSRFTLQAPADITRLAALSPLWPGRLQGSPMPSPLQSPQLSARSTSGDFFIAPAPVPLGMQCGPDVFGASLTTAPGTGTPLLTGRSIRGEFAYAAMKPAAPAPLPMAAASLWHPGGSAAPLAAAAGDLSAQSHTARSASPLVSRQWSSVTTSMPMASASFQAASPLVQNTSWVSASGFFSTPAQWFPTPRTPSLGLGLRQGNAGQPSTSSFNRASSLQHFRTPSSPSLSARAVSPQLWHREIRVPSLQLLGASPAPSPCHSPCLTERSLSVDGGVSYRSSLSPQLPGQPLLGGGSSLAPAGSSLWQGGRRNVYSVGASASGPAGPAPLAFHGAAWPSGSPLVSSRATLPAHLQSPLQSPMRHSASAHPMRSLSGATLLPSNGKRKSPIHSARLPSEDATRLADAFTLD